MNVNTKVMGKAPVVFLAGALLLAGCAGGPLSTREKGAGIGALGGAAAGGLIGAAVGHPCSSRRPIARAGEHQLSTATAN